MSQTGVLIPRKFHWNPGHSWANLDSTEMRLGPSTCRLTVCIQSHRLTQAHKLNGAPVTALCHPAHKTQPLVTFNMLSMVDTKGNLKRRDVNQCHHFPRMCYHQILQYEITIILCLNTCLDYVGRHALSHHHHHFRLLLSADISNLIYMSQEYRPTWKVSGTKWNQIVPPSSIPW